MKLLIIDAGPRLCNTWKVTSLVKEELYRYSEEIEFEEIHLKDLNLPYCLGCSLCFRIGHRNCPHNSVIQTILDSFEECDGLIFTAPTYNLQIPALGKNLIDHLCFLLHRPVYFDKKALIISTTGGVGAKSATKYVADTLTGIGFNRCYQLPIASISWNAYKPSEKDRKHIGVTVKRFYKDVASHKLHAPSFSSVFVFNLFRGISTNYVKGAEYETEDGVFWQQEGYKDVTYAPNVPMSIFPKIYGTIFYHVGKCMAKRLVVTYKK